MTERRLWKSPAARGACGFGIPGFALYYATMSTEFSGALLVVDHDKSSREALLQQLTTLAHRVTPADNPRQATAILITNPLDLVVLNAALPNNGAAHLLKRLRDDPDLPPVPVLGPGPPEAVGQCLAAGADDFLLTPYSLEMLRGRVRGALERQQLRREVE